MATLGLTIKLRLLDNRLKHWESVWVWFVRLCRYMVWNIRRREFTQHTCQLPSSQLVSFAHVCMNIVWNDWRYNCVLFLWIFVVIPLSWSVHILSKMKGLTFCCSLQKPSFSQKELEGTPDLWNLLADLHILLVCVPKPLGWSAWLLGMEDGYRTGRLPCHRQL